MKTIITADIGVNHNGNFDLLIRLLRMIHKVEVATDEKILVKMQKRNPERYSTDSYDSWVLNKRVEYREHKRALEFGLDEWLEFDRWCDKLNLEWYASVFDFDSLEFITANFPHLRHWKIASPVTADSPDLVAAICKQPGLKFMSTGMCSIKELDRSMLAALKEVSENDLILMHCVSIYPTPVEKVNLATMSFLRERYGLRVGYSSHDASVPISVAAVAMGAVAIEKHVTIDHTLPGPDHALSLEYRGLETLVKHISAVENAIGLPSKPYYLEEQNVRKKVKITA